MDAQNTHCFPVGLQPTDLIRGESRDPWPCRRELSKQADSLSMTTGTCGGTMDPAFAGEAIEGNLLQIRNGF